MRVFLFEFISGGGCFYPPRWKSRPPRWKSLPRPPCMEPAGSLLDEGHAMWRAIYDDLACIDQVDVITTRDARLAPLDIPFHSIDRFAPEQLVELAKSCDVALIIAPEFDDHLLNLATMFEQHQCQLLGPDSQFIKLASDKTATAERLTAANVPTPPSRLVPTGERLFQDFDYPAVVKPNDGAGSMGRVFESWSDETYDQPMRIEQFVHGVPCSVSLLCRGLDGPVPFPPMRQLISNDGLLQYQGGERLMNDGLVERAFVLAKKTMDALPPTTGYLGIDMILGGDPNTPLDWVVEVNPRITTSYIGLRQLAKKNLAQVMIETVQGRNPQLTFSADPIRFLPNGNIGK